MLSCLIAVSPVITLPDARHPRSDQPLPLVHPDDPDLVHAADQVVQPLAEVLHGGGVVDQKDLLDQVGRAARKDGPQGPLQRRPGLVVEADDDGGGGKLL